MQTAYEKKNGISIYANQGYAKGLPKSSRNPECIKMVLINKLLNLLKPKCTTREYEKVNTLIWDIAVASYEHGKGE
jgi:hypothetical protein|tara:strand:- start:78 stop:305 length:228 start_codon:yes stop_codon:yes gene_type:complete